MTRAIASVSGAEARGDPGGVGAVEDAGANTEDHRGVRVHGLAAPCETACGDSGQADTHEVAGPFTVDVGDRVGQCGGEHGFLAGQPVLRNVDGQMRHGADLVPFQPKAFAVKGIQERSPMSTESDGPAVDEAVRTRTA
jgi:hypothetical protein